MTRLEFIKLIEQYFPNHNKNFMDKIDLYTNYLRQENQKYNLTRLDSEELIYGKYYFNSLIPFINYNISNQTILDIGSGSGIPGIALKCLFPDIRLTVMDANQKKTNFLKQLVQQLQFEGVNVLWQRAEEIPFHLNEEFDIVTSRAVAKLPVLLEISCQYVKIGGFIIEPKSSEHETEFNEAIVIAPRLNLAHHTTHDFKVFEDNRPTVVFIKSGHTSQDFPRAWKEIMREQNE